MDSQRRRAPITRRHHLRRVAALLGLVAVAATLSGWAIYRASRPDVRRPGEDLPEITENLSKGLPQEAPEPRFTDVTVAAGLGDFVSFVGPRTSQLPEDMGPGLAWGDFDNDGDDDLFVVAAGGALNRPETWSVSRLYENRVQQGEAGFRAVEDFPSPRIVGMGAAWGDADGDGWQDLVVTGYGGLLLFRNHQGRFVADPRFPQLEGFWAGASWADFDLDGDLDLYVCGYVKYVEDAGDRRSTSRQYGSAVPYTLNPASFEPERNLLLQNAGDGTFEEVSMLYGVSNPEGRSLSALWHDFDADGRPDLYVANDISDNALYLNRGDSFQDAGLEAWVADYRGAMGLAAGDWNRDGDDDLFVTHWIAQENALYDSRLAGGHAEPTSSPPARLTFSDVASQVGLGQEALHLVGWGTEFADFDADGWLDLLVANGSTLEVGDPPRQLETQPAKLFWNQQGRHFHDLAARAPALSRERNHRGLAVSDFDLDGDLDVAISHLDGGVRLLRNDTHQGHWLGLRLQTPTGRGEGALVVVHAGDVELRRSVTGASYLSQSSRSLHFGLGVAGLVDRIEVHWPGGDRQTFTGLEVDALWLLSKGEPKPTRLGSPAGSARAGMAADPPGSPLEPARVREFWSTQRAAMDAMKRDGDSERAIALLRRALEIDPRHADSRYYLANSLWTTGRPEEALAELDRLRRENPGSHRAHKQWGVIRALTAASESDLEAAREALERAIEINAEETGALFLLGQIALIEGREEEAEQHFEWICRTHPKAVGAFFLRAYLAWKAGRHADAGTWLRAAHAARGDHWKPEGTAGEGDVARRMHREETPLGRFWTHWNGDSDPDAAFSELEDHLEQLSRSL